mgnify:CR=1 FL=1
MRGKVKEGKVGFFLGGKVVGGGGKKIIKKNATYNFIIIIILKGGGVSFGGKFKKTILSNEGWSIIQNNESKRECIEKEEEYSSGMRKGVGGKVMRS